MREERTGAREERTTTSEAGKIEGWVDQRGGDGGLVSVRRTNDGSLGGWTSKRTESGVDRRRKFHRQTSKSDAKVPVVELY